MVLAIAAFGAVSGCQRTSSEEVILEVARTDAAMPDCASLRVIEAEQREEKGYYLLFANVVGTRSCMTRWNRNLTNSEFEVQQPHGEWVKSVDPLALVSLSFEGRAGFILPMSNPIPGLETITPGGMN